MIEKMHEKSNSWTFKIIFALVSLSFVLGGIGSGFMMADTSAVKINGEEISQNHFTNEKNRAQNLRFNQEGDAFWDKLKHDPQYAQQFQDSVFNSLINDELIRQYTQELKLSISEAQIKAEIVNNPSFHQNGKFDNALYQQALRNNGIHPDQYAAIVADGMVRSQLQEGIIQSEFTVPAQQEVLAKLLMQTRQVRLASYPIAAELSNQTASDEEAKAFYDTHQNSFVNPEKLTVEYVLFTPKELESKINVDQAQIETYYQTNKAKFVTAGENRFAHIQVATEEEAKAIAQAVKNGEDFAKLAKEKSQDKGSAAQGGDLGWSKAGTFPVAFEETAKALQVGQTSDAVAIDGAFHVIKLLDRKETSEIPLEKLKDQIASTIRNELIRTEYSTLTREMAKQAYENSGSLEAVAKIAGIQVQKTAEFGLDSIPTELSHEKLVTILADAEWRKNGQNSEAIELGTETAPQTMFLRVSQHQAQSVQPFEQAKTAVFEAVKHEKASKALKAKGEELLKALQNGNADGIKFGEPQNLVFAQAQVQQPQLAKRVFAMPTPADKGSYQMVQDANGDVALISLDKVIDGNIEQFKPLAAQLAQADQMVLFNNLLLDLRGRAKIEINEEFADQQLKGND